MASWLTWTGVALLGLTLACGGDDDKEPQGPPGTQIDCSWFENDNCYRQAVASVRSCLPDSAASGTLSAAGDRCTYASGHTITFNTPVNLAASDDQKWDFSIASSAGQCVAYHDTTGGLRLETPSGTFVEDTVGAALQFTCPDGSQFYMASAFEALNCDLGHLPGYYTSSSSTAVVFGFLGGSDGAFKAFECKTP
jgi:hypothetical protein